jgi:hypothetical protein
MPIVTEAIGTMPTQPNITQTAIERPRDVEITLGKVRETFIDLAQAAAAALSAVQRLSSAAGHGRSRSGRDSPISLGMKQMGNRSASRHREL